MSMSREQWLATQAASRQTRSRPTVHRCGLVARPDGRFDVRIEGTDLRTGAVPPLIHIGGRPARRIESHGGTVLRAVVDRGEPGDEVTIDLGPAGTVRATVGRVS
ncbi:hypothetical protein O7623_16620 [Solwaraspora sp. WMMD791]|uniref:hypothetical protein n=1 Tax=Solwaraspora sp. WMMD791 TaxID=3016086 RepID=UPI002499C271|nr:hypothetical protein [Solwaraspora sp. WMMD791]WFE25045.1 hypothetical protein O7623_16620 [Solwaraspora sp. WMMD791]